MEPELMTIEAAARYLMVGRATAYTWARAGLIPTVRVNGLLRVPRSGLDKWIAAQADGQGATARPTPTDPTRGNP